MRLFLYLLLIATFITSCHDTYTLSPVWIGLNHVIYSRISNPQWSELPPPPPPPDENILQHNLFIAIDTLYYYILPYRPLECATPYIEMESPPERLFFELMRLDRDQITVVNSRNFDSIYKNISLHTAHELSHIAIGIDHDSSSHPLVIDMVTRLAQKDKNITWKVRKTLAIEYEKVRHKSYHAR